MLVDRPDAEEEATVSTELYEPWGNSSANWTSHVEPALPVWSLWSYVAGLGAAGVLLNAWVAVGAWRHGRCTRGRAQLMLLAQLALADAASLLLVAPTEVSVLAREGVWTMSQGWCASFLGLESLLGAACSYLVVSVSVHALLSPPADNSRCCVPVASSWLLAGSVAAPLVWQATTVQPRPGLTVCSLHPPQELAQVLLGAVRAALPALLLLLCSVATLVKMRSVRPSDAADGNTSQAEQLRVSLLLALSHCVLALHRPAVVALSAVVPLTAEPLGPAAAFSAPPLSTGQWPLCTLALSMLHHLLPTLRPVLLCAASEHLRAAMRCGQGAARTCQPLQRN